MNSAAKMMIGVCGGVAFIAAIVTSSCFALRSAKAQIAGHQIPQALSRIDPYAPRLVDRLERAHDLNGTHAAWAKISGSYEINAQSPSDRQIVFVFHRKPTSFIGRLAAPKMIISLYDLPTSSVLSVKSEGVW